MSRRPPPLRLLVWRARIPLTVLMGLVGAVVVVDAVRPAPEPHVTVLVAARALDAGTELAAGDVRAARWPERLAPDEASAQPSRPDDLAGRTLAVAVPAGMPLADGVLTGEEWWEDAPPGSVAAPVRLSDAELAGLLRVGDRVDVYVAAVEGGKAERVAHAALVLAGPATAEPAAGGLFGGGTSTASGLVLLAVSSSEAAVLAGHAGSGVLSAVLVQ
ncbi:MAG: flagellar biosynthesis protein FlgA [Actinomycetales bacterium]|nr:flagellar biosynthesis protein FlgA [Actinomycetales bacterium]